MHLTLAQAFDTVPDLDGPPILERMFLVEPVGGMLIVAIAAALASTTLRRADKETVANIVIGVGLAAAIGVLGIGRVVTTQHEALIDASRAFADAVASSDQRALEAVLDENLVIASAGQNVDNAGKQWVMSAAAFASPLIESYRVRNRGTERTATNAGRARVAVNVQTNQGPGPTTWDLYWQQDANNAWRLVRADALLVLGRTPDSPWWVRNVNRR